MDKVRKNILLSGTMRSGTTLMCAVLDAHPDISMVSDLLTWFWKYCFPRYGKMETEYELEWALYELEPHMIHHQNKININGLKREVKRKGISYLSLYDTLVEQLYVGELKTIRGIKSTHAAYHYESFISAMPNAYVIHMVRNCRDVYYSHKRRVAPDPASRRGILRRVWRLLMFRKNEIGRYLIGKRLLLDDRIFYPFLYKNPIRMVDEWTITAKLTLELGNRYPDRIVIVRFEDLVNDTEKTLRQLIEKIGAVWYDGFYDYAKLRDRNGRQFRANTSFGNRNIQGFSGNYTMRSVEFLTDDEKKYYNNVARETELRLGYSYE
jgi:hypothetical protein